MKGVARPRIALRGAVIAALTGLAPFGCASGGDAANSAGAGGTSGAGTGGASSGASATGGTSTGGSSGAGTLSYRPCALDTRVGTFTVELGEKFTAVTGAVRNAVAPSEVPELVEEEGTCRVYRERILFCDPPCGSGTTCSEALACIPAPANQSVGTVSVAGLAVPLEMTPSGVNSYTNPASPALPHPGFTEGADIVLVAAGGASSSFELHGRGIAALKLQGESLTLERGKPLAVSWLPPGEANGQLVRLMFELNRHGGTPTWLECDAPDTGSFDVPASLVDGLLELEVSGWPTLSASRRTVDSTAVSDGCVELRVVSSVTIDVELPGVISCDTENPCPLPQLCQANLLCE